MSGKPTKPVHLDEFFAAKEAWATARAAFFVDAGDAQKKQAYVSASMRLRTAMKEVPRKLWKGITL
jgi:hypothetical protein